MSTAELACSYAALILADEGIEITADKLQTLITAAKVQEVEPIWTSIFAKALEGKDIKDMLTNVGSAGAAAPVAAGGAVAATADAPAAEEKEEEKEESDEDMGFGLFD
ncbi:60s acidic ribosomal protein-domain-containing protein [Aspergillus varians]